MKIAVLLSGGVDSSVALNLLSNEGRHEITAFYLKIWLEEEMSFMGDCPWEEDLNYARAVCKQASIPLKVLSLQTEYWDRIVKNAVAELKAGRTPSPDILCNQRIKFGSFFEKIDSTYNKVASGHYAQVTEEPTGSYLLKRAPDPVKDQTYFLSALNQSQLSRILFPIGHLKKNDVREMAESMNLPNRSRKDSQGICFLGKIKFADFVRFHLGEQTGDMVELDTGKKLSEHKGVWFHTIGQRKGLGLSGGPWYVVKKDLKKNILFISHSESFSDHSTSELTVHGMHWISGKAPEKRKLQTRIRHTPQLEDCQIEELADNKWKVCLKNPEKAAAPGQSAILYDQEICLGGGIIE